MPWLKAAAIDQWGRDVPHAELEDNNDNDNNDNNISIIIIVF